MTATYELWYTDDAGNPLELLDNVISFSYVPVVGDVGIGSFTLPYDAGRLYVLPRRDRRIHVWRRSEDGGRRLYVYFIRRWEFQTDEAGQTTVLLTGVDQYDQLRRRVAAYRTGSAQALMTGYAGDIMKEIVRDNLGADAGTDYDGAAVTGRDLSSLGIVVTGNLSDGPSITAEFGWKYVLDALQSIRSTSRSEGTEVYFLFYPNTPTSFVFETRTGQPGRDRTGSGSSPLFFGVDFGNVRNPALAYDYLEEENHIYVGGGGQNDQQVIVEVSDSNGVNASIWNRREGYATSSLTDDTNAMASAGNARLAEKSPRITLVADLLDTQQTPYGGLDGWDLGDRVTITHLGIQFEAVITSVMVSIPAGGVEIITGRAEC